MRPRLSLSPISMLLFGAALFSFFSAGAARTQEVHETDPVAALAAALGAACRGNQTQFANYLTAENAAAFLGLPEEQRAAFLKRFSLSDSPGKTLLSSDPQKRTVFRCETPSGAVEYRFGDTRTHENLAFIPVSVLNSQQAEFGLVRENGGWRLLSLGILLLDIPQLSKQWAEQDLAAREDAALQTLKDLAEAIRTYRRAFGKLPESLALLGPAPKNEISPDQADLINAQLAAGSQAGYQFRYRIVPAAIESEARFELAATPEEYGKSGKRSFFLDTDGKVHAEDKHGAVAGPQSPLLTGEKTP
ncbi:MAG TPA: hypothetical protein VEU52_09955 [Candidatus Limnocylindrales bacterium]|nr:hypothetical protein [Candidatus Limnocylindrales bacterium]